MTGVARNLLGTTKTLDFKKVTEGEAIYYLATVPFTHKEVLRFDINIEQGKTSQNLHEAPISNNWNGELGAPLSA